MSDQVVKMDRMYRWTRHVYDLSRKYYLLGRDRLLEQIARDGGEAGGGQPRHILEMGCGTARNLIRLHRLSPLDHLYGLDAANVMIDTATKAAARAGAADAISLRQCLAEQVDPQQTFGLDQPFDAIFFSYSLSMIPTWRQAIDAALTHLKPAGKVYIVDFWDQADLPAWFSRTLKWWLAKFHVHHRPELYDYLESLRESGQIAMTTESIKGRYAILAVLQKV